MNKKMSLFAIFGTIGAILLAILVHFVVSPLVAESKAQDFLDSLTNFSKDITLENSDVLVLNSQTVDNASFDNKALGVGSDVTYPASFIFTNGSSSSGKTVEVFVDFAEQQSRDFILQNQISLKALVESGTITLKVYITTSNGALSIYAAEAFAEGASAQPNMAWDYFIQLLKTSATVVTDDSGVISEQLVNSAQSFGISTVTSDSISSGSFVNWLLTVGNDPRLNGNVHLPLIYVDDVMVDDSLVDINNPNAFTNYILGVS